MPLWLSKGEKGPTARLNFHCSTEPACSRRPRRQQRLDVAKTDKPVGQQGSSLTSNPPKHQAPKATQCPRVHSPSPKRTESLFFPRHLSPDATSSRLLSSHPHSLSSTRTTRPESLPRSFFHPAPARFSTESVYDFPSRSHLLPPIYYRGANIAASLSTAFSAHLTQTIPASCPSTIAASPPGLNSRSHVFFGRRHAAVAHKWPWYVNHPPRPFHSPPCGAVSPVVAPNARRHELTCHNSSPTSCHLCLPPSTQLPQRHC